VKITDANGKPVSKRDLPEILDNTTVVIRDKDGNETVVKPGKDGTFSKELPVGEYVVEVRPPSGFTTPKPQEAKVTENQTTPLQSFEVKPTDRPLKDNSRRELDGTISGWLVDETGRPIRNGEIRLTAPAKDPTTGEDFLYEAPVTVDEDGYFITPVIDFKYFPDGEAEFSYEVVLPKDFPKTDKNGNPITDRNGNRLFDDEGNPIKYPVKDKITGSTKVTKDSPMRIDPIRIDAPLTEVKGTIDDGQGNAVPGVYVVVTDERGNSQTIKPNEKGEFVAENIPPGVVDVEFITPEGIRDIDPLKVPVRPGQPVDLPTIHLSEAGENGNNATGKNASINLEKRLWHRDADNGEFVPAEDGDFVEDVMNVRVGDQLKYSFIITNTGDETLTGISDKTVDDREFAKRGIKLQMPEGWSENSELPKGESVVFTGVMEADDAFEFNNIATANAKTVDGRTIGSSPDGAYLKVGELKVEKKVNARFATNPDEPVKVRANNAAEFTYEVVNTGSTPMVGVTVKDLVFEGDLETFDPENPGSEGKPLEVKAPAGFNGVLFPGQGVIFTAKIPKMPGGIAHHNAAEARGELPKRPARGIAIDDEPDFGEDPSRSLIITPRDNIKGNAHIIVEEGAEIKSDVQAVVWIDRNGNGRQDEGEGLEGTKLTLRSLDDRPARSAYTDQNGNVLFESAPEGKYYLQLSEYGGGLKLEKPRDEKANTFDAKVLESEEFELTGEEIDGKIVGLKLIPQEQKAAATSTAAVAEDEGSSLGKCLAAASSVSNPIAWLVPIGLSAAVLGGLGVMFEDELNAAAAQVNEMISQVVPNVNLNIQRPAWMDQIQAQVDQVNRQLAEINPAAPAAAAGVALLGIVGLATALYYLSCEAGWVDVDNQEGSSSQEGSSKKEKETTSTAPTTTPATKPEGEK